MFDKAVDTHPPIIKYITECCKNQEMCNKAVHRCFFVFDSIPDQYKTHEICDIVVSVYPFSTVYCPDKYITQKMCEKGILWVNLNNINLDNNFDEDDPDTIILIRLLAWHNKFK